MVSKLSEAHIEYGKYKIGSKPTDAYILSSEPAALKCRRGTYPLGLSEPDNGMVIETEMALIFNWQWILGQGKMVSRGEIGRDWALYISFRWVSEKRESRGANSAEWMS